MQQITFVAAGFRALATLAAAVLLLHFVSPVARAAEQTYDEWLADIDETNRLYIQSLTRSIGKNVPEAKKVLPGDFSYGEKEARDALSAKAIQAVKDNRDDDAVAAWVELFKLNNVNLAHAAGYEASADVLREVAKFFLTVNRLARDDHAAGSFEYRAWDSAVRATQKLIDAQ